MSPVTRANRSPEREALSSVNDESRLTETFDALRSGQVRASDVAQLSDLSRAEARALADLWPSLPEGAREAVVRQVEHLASERVELNFGRVLRIALDDDSAVVRQLALAALWEDESADMLGLLSLRLATDTSPDVRAEAAKGLGRFVELMVSQGADDHRAVALRTSLTEIAGDPRAAYGVRRGALESVGAFGNDASVQSVIQRNYDSDDQGLVASSLYAMGRSRDPRWLPTIAENLTSDEDELRFEAARAAGDMGDIDAVPLLANLCIDEDVEVRHAAISSLGQIGGRAALRTLHRLAEEPVEGDADLIVEAAAEAELIVDPLPTASS